MKSSLSITFAILAVGSAGWFLVPGTASVRHEGRPATASSVIFRGDAWMIDDAGNDRVASNTIPGNDPRAETARRPAVSSHPLSTVRISEAQGSSSPTARKSPSIGPPQSFTAVNQIRPTAVSKERTRSKFTSATAHRNPARQGSSVPLSLKSPVSPANSDTVEPAEIPLEDLTSANPAGVPVPNKAPEDQVVTDPNTPQPAVWVDLGAASSLPQDKQDHIQGLAESLSRKISESGLDPTSPEYKQVWDDAVVASDQLFRQQYGNQAWMEHHIQAHHLAQSAGK